MAARVVIVRSSSKLPKRLVPHVPDLQKWCSTKLGRIGRWADMILSTCLVFARNTFHFAQVYFLLVSS